MNSTLQSSNTILYFRHPGHKDHEFERKGIQDRVCTGPWTLEEGDRQRWAGCTGGVKHHQTLRLTEYRYGEQGSP
jgi:hypothetical protein